MDSDAPNKRYILNGDRLDILDWPAILDGVGRLGTITIEQQYSCSFAVEDSYAATVLADGYLLGSDDAGRRLIACSDLLPRLQTDTEAPVIQDAAYTQPSHTAGNMPGTPYRGKSHKGWRLRPLGVISIHTSEFMCRNSDEKGIARVWLVDLKSSRQLTLVYFKPLRGYEREASAYFRFFKHGAGLAPSSTNRYPFHTALGLREPTQPDHAVDLDKAATNTLRRRLQAYAAEAYWQINGIISDSDPECLHQFRVELRKMRSLISLFKPLLTSYHQELKAALNALMSRTNSLRDLDVLLESRHEFLRDKDPDQARKGYQALFKRIAAARALEQAAVSAWLKSEASSIKTRRVLQLLKNRSPIWKWPRPSAAMAALLKQRILKAYAKVKAATLELSAEAPPTEVHRLRILHKHLRYLLDFSLDLQDDHTTSTLLGILKNSQKHLGNYNDAEVQLAWFRSWADSLAGDFTNTERTAIVLLIKTIENRVAERRARAIEHASECISPDTEALLHALGCRKEAQ